MAACDLNGLASEWESDKQVREFVRVKNCLFAPALRCAAPECNVACAERNYDQLAPLAKRLRLPNGHVGQVLRRSQHALKPDKSEAKVGDEAKDEEAEVKNDEDDEAKDDPAPKARGRPRAKAQPEKPTAKAKGKAKAKAKGAAKAKGKAKEDPEEGNHNAAATETSMAKEQPPTTMVVDPKPEVVVPPSDANKAEVDANTKKPDGDDQEPKVARKRRTRKASDKTQDSAGSEPKKVTNKRKKTDGAEVAKGPAKAAANEDDVKEAKGDEAEGEEKDEGGEGEAAPKKRTRTRHAETQTFARRPLPSTTFGQAKWHALRRHFAEKIRPNLRHYSAHEDLWFTKNTFWFTNVSTVFNL
eukprot:Skav207509  [mRNA]  locus=scaffold7671:1493:3962:+ [translate_table: standard]